MQPQYPYQPVPQPPKRNAWQWYRSQNGCLKIVIALALLFIVLFAGIFCAAGIAVATGHGVQPTPASQSAAISTPTPTPTKAPTHAPPTAPTTKPTAASVPPTPTPLPTAAPSSPLPALLGAPINAFDAQYGPRDLHTNASSGDYHYRKYADSNTDYLLVDTDLPDGGKYASLAYFITVQADNAGWTTTQASQQCGLFLPQDAVYQKSIPVASGPSLDKVYYSASLAPIFPASSFYDANQNPVKPGTFDVQYLYRDASQTVIDSCSIIIGEQQTK